VVPELAKLAGKAKEVVGWIIMTGQAHASLLINTSISSKKVKHISTHDDTRNSKML
jgi:hypothetical protein